MLQVVVGVKANKKWVKSRKHDDLIWIHRISEYCTSIKTANICPLFVIYQLVLVRTHAYIASLGSIPISHPIENCITATPGSIKLG